MVLNLLSIELLIFNQLKPCNLLRELTIDQNEQIPIVTYIYDRVVRNLTLN